MQPIDPTNPYAFPFGAYGRNPYGYYNGYHQQPYHHTNPYAYQPSEFGWRNEPQKPLQILTPLPIHNPIYTSNFSPWSAASCQFSSSLYQPSEIVRTPSEVWSDGRSENNFPTSLVQQQKVIEHCIPMDFPIEEEIPASIDMESNFTRVLDTEKVAICRGGVSDEVQNHQARCLSTSAIAIDSEFHHEVRDPTTLNFAVNVTNNDDCSSVNSDWVVELDENKGCMEEIGESVQPSAFAMCSKMGSLNYDQQAFDEMLTCEVLDNIDKLAYASEVLVETKHWDGSHAEIETSHTEDKVAAVEKNSSISYVNEDYLEAQEKAKELELELETVAGALIKSISQNVKLKDELMLTKETLQETTKKFKELELSHKELQQQSVESECRPDAKLNVLQEALQAKEVTTTEAFDRLSLEFEGSKKKIEELAQQLLTSTCEALRFKELYKQNVSLTESKIKRVMELEGSLELSKRNAKEVEEEMASLKEEFKGLYEQISTSRKVEEVFSCTDSELSRVRGELNISKSQLQDSGNKLEPEEVVIAELREELDKKKASESLLEGNISTLELLLSFKASELDGMILKLHEEVDVREHVEAKLKSQETQTSMSHEELAKLSTKKGELETVVAQLGNNAVNVVTNSLEILEDVLHYSRPDSKCILHAMLVITGSYANPILVDKLGAGLESIAHGDGTMNMILLDKLLVKVGKGEQEGVQQIKNKIPRGKIMSSLEGNVLSILAERCYSDTVEAFGSIKMMHELLEKDISFNKCAWKACNIESNSKTATFGGSLQFPFNPGVDRLFLLTLQEETSLKFHKVCVLSIAINNLSMHFEFMRFEHGVIVKVEHYLDILVVPGKHWQLVMAGEYFGRPQFKLGKLSSHCDVFKALKRNCLLFWCHPYGKDEVFKTRNGLCLCFVTELLMLYPSLSKSECQYLGEFYFVFGPETLGKGSEVSKALSMEFASIKGNGTIFNHCVTVEKLWQCLPSEGLWIIIAKVGHLQSTTYKVKGTLVLERYFDVCEYLEFPFDPGDCMSYAFVTPIPMEEVYSSHSTPKVLKALILAVVLHFHILTLEDKGDLKGGDLIRSEIESSKFH